MQYHPPSGSTDPNASYVGKNVAAGQLGSKVPPGAIETVQREIVNAIGLAGLTPTDTDLYQLTRVIRGGQLDYGNDTGTANALLASIGLAHTQIRAGLPFKVLKGNSANTSTTPTLTITGPSGANAITGVITKSDGSALAPGDLPANAMLIVVADGVNWRLLALVLRSDVLALIAANGAVIRVTDTAGASTAQSLVGTGAPAITAYAQSQVFLFTAAAANTGPAPTGNVTGVNGKALGALPFVKRDGSPLAAGDIPAGAEFLAALDPAGAALRVLGLAPSDVAALVAAIAPVVLKANKTIYVDLATGTLTPGSDTTGDGSQAKPFATIARAISYGQTFAAAGFGIIVQLVTAGTYAAPGAAVTGVPNLQIVGSASNQAGYVLSANLAGSTSLVNVSACNCALVGVTLFVSQASNGWASTGFGGNLVLQNVGFTDNVTSTSPVIGAGNGGTVSIGTGCTVGAAGAGVGAAALYSASANGLIYQTAYVNILAGCAFQTTVTFSDGGRVIIPSNVGFTGPGATSTSGARYAGNYCASQNVSGGGANVNPGNAAGSVSGNAFYG